MKLATGGEVELDNIAAKTPNSVGDLSGLRIQRHELKARRIQGPIGGEFNAIDQVKDRLALDLNLPSRQSGVSLNFVN